MNTYQTRPWNVDEEVERLIKEARDVETRSGAPIRRRPYPRDLGPGRVSAPEDDPGVSQRDPRGGW